MPEPPVLDQLNLVVRDMDAALAFYRRLGLALPDAWRTASGPHHAQVEMANGLHLEFDSVAMARHYNQGFREAGDGGSRVVLGIRLSSREAVDELHDDLVAAGGASRQDPHDAFWGARYAIVADPDDNDVGLMSPIDPARRTAPPSL